MFSFRCQQTFVRWILGKWDSGKWSFGKVRFWESGIWEIVILVKLNFGKVFFLEKCDFWESVILGKWDFRKME